MARDDRYDDEAYYGDGGGGGMLGGISVGLLLIIGVVLFFFPEPITSTIGIILIAVAVIAWAAEAMM